MPSGQTERKPQIFGRLRVWSSFIRLYFLIAKKIRSKVVQINKNSDFILFARKKEKKRKSGWARRGQSVCINKCAKIHCENLQKRNEEIALMAILFRILFTLGLLILHVSVLSGEQTTKRAPKIGRKKAYPVETRFSVCVCNEWHCLSVIRLRRCVNYEWNFTVYFSVFFVLRLSSFGHLLVVAAAQFNSFRNRRCHHTKTLCLSNFALVRSEWNWHHLQSLCKHRK